MKEIEITVKHAVSPDPVKCTFDEDAEGYSTLCRYHAFRNQTHGKKRPTEYHKPKCTLFDCWLDAPYHKCAQCRTLCKEAEKGECE